MTPDLLIRQARLTDVKSIWDIERLSFPAPWSFWCFLSEMGNPNSTILVAGPPSPKNWKTWGYIVYWVIAGEMHVMNLAVHPRHRRRGVAKALLREAMHRARDQGAVVAWLEVRPSNQAAQTLYKSFGFRKVGVRPRYYADNQEDALLMAYYWEEEVSSEQ
ncbi:MAG: ribosomal protein S18-alanine N-acetyltransferase [Deltaproteobacteria bacterium]|nr:ribosomal protein S18-alanine N-acetyltransferase [Deltaproteobacteria bacterium]